jgi:hypothetical protein
VLFRSETEAKKKAREEQAEKEFMDALKAREEAMWEKSRQKRVNGWRAWQGSEGASKPKIPKLKEERKADGSGYNSYRDEKGEEYKKEWR